MNCKRARSEIALWVGNDLDEVAEAKLEQHLAECHHCRKNWREMQASLSTLREPNYDSYRSQYDSVWPRLSAQLPSREEIRRAERFNGWLPAVTVVAACLMMATFSMMNLPGESSAPGAVASDQLAPIVLPVPVVLPRQDDPLNLFPIPVGNDPRFQPVLLGPNGTDPLWNDFLQSLENRGQPLKFENR